MLNVKRERTSPDEDTRPLKRRFANPNGYEEARRNILDRQAPKPILVPIEENTLRQMKKKLHSAVSYIDEALLIEKDIDKKYVTDILAGKALIKLYLDQARVSKKAEPPITIIWENASVNQKEVKVAETKQPRLHPVREIVDLTETDDSEFSSFPLERRERPPFQDCFHCNSVFVAPELKKPHDGIAYPPKKKAKRKKGWRHTKATPFVGIYEHGIPRRKMRTRPLKLYHCRLCDVEIAKKHLARHLSGKKHINHKAKLQTANSGSQK